MDQFSLLVEAHRPAMKAVLARLVEILHAHRVRYVVGGASALALYARPRMTVDVDAFVDAARKDEIDRVLAEHFEVVYIERLHSKFKQDDVEIDILCSGAPAEDFALASARDAMILGAKVKAASPEALLWLYLVSQKEQNYVDALQLLRSHPALDVALVRKQLEKHDAALVRKLENLQLKAREPEISYEASRARRS